MPNIEVSKTAQQPARGASRDVFEALHDEIAFSTASSRVAILFRGDEIIVPDLDVHENGQAVTIERKCSPIAIKPSGSWFGRGRPSFMTKTGTCCGGEYVPKS